MSPTEEVLRRAIIERELLKLREKEARRRRQIDEAIANAQWQRLVRRWGNKHPESGV